MKPDNSASGEFTKEERAQLLAIAREAIAAALANRPYQPGAGSQRLAEPRAAFTTIYVRGQLRGCVGNVIASEPLAQAVAHTAVSAATTDPRFPALTPAELGDTTIDLSVLSALTPITPEQIVIGRHGLLVAMSGQRGLLLPQVPVEHHWDVPMFLAQTCMKAQLSPIAWRAGAELFGFTAEVFGDEKNVVPPGDQSPG